MQTKINCWSRAFTVNSSMKFCFCLSKTNKNYAEFTSKQLKLYRRVLFVFVYAVTRSCVILMCAEDYTKLQCLCIPRRLITLSRLVLLLVSKYISIVHFEKQIRQGLKNNLESQMSLLASCTHFIGPSCQVQSPWDSVENEYKSGKSLAFLIKRV